jgi:ribonuclease Z
LARVVVLGTAGAVASAAHGHTYLAIDGEGFLLVDCGDMPVARIRRAGLGLDRLQGVIVTHFHPDHVASLPVLVVSAWLLGRKAPLPVHGLDDVTGRFAALMGLFRSEEWPGLFGLPARSVDRAAGALVLENEEFRITSAPVCHPVPTIGLRIENRRSGNVVAYSADTEPCDAVVALARGASILFHEATGATVGHSSAAQAGAIARRAEVGRLVLVHYPPSPDRHADCTEDASEAFGGRVELAQDFDEYQF